MTVEGILTLYGAVSPACRRGWRPPSPWCTWPAWPWPLWAVCRAFRRFFSASDLIVPVMATGIVINLAAYMSSIVPSTWFDTREIPAVLPFGAVLAGRLLAEPLARAWLRPVLAGVLACYAVALGYGVAQPPVADSEQPVVGWLEAHHLSTGLGTYTEANVITLDSGGRVAVRTVSWQRPGAVPRAYESKASWYDPRLSYANFVVINSADDRRQRSLIPRGDILALAGPPAHTYHYKTFTIMVWNHNLLADLGCPPSPVARRRPLTRVASFAATALRRSVHWRND